MEKYITENTKETQKLGAKLARKLKSGGIVCLSGDLGSGKTTFTQGLLKGLKIEGSYTSPTFMIIKHYHKEIPISKSQFPNKSKIRTPKNLNIYHVDAYRVKAKDILNLGWEEIIGNDKNIVIIEWAERIKRIMPYHAMWIKFKWIDKNKREIIFKN